jgi:uncharacterized protein with von Willebrand factor type A (vWA) domain
VEQSLTNFVGELRRTGIKVSQAELLDALGALSYPLLETRSLFKDSLRSTLVKRARDIPVFDTLFDLHFAGGLPVGAVPEEKHEEGLQRISDQVAELLSAYQGELSPVTRMIMTGQFGPMVRLLLDRSAGLGLKEMIVPPLRGTFFLNRFRREMELDRVKPETEQLLNEMDERGLDADSIQAIRDFVDQNLVRLEEEVENIVEREMGKSRFLNFRRIDDQELANRNLFRLSEEDVLAMRPAVERLARRLKDRLSLRLKWADKGRFDLKTTLRRNIGFGGPLPELRFRHKNPAKPQVVALCDVSRSVRDFSRFMLIFLFTLNEVIARIRSFIFVGDMVEVTRLFRQNELDEAVSLAASGHGLRYPFGTDYGSSLAWFAEQHLTTVNSRTTLLILGDARNNNLHPRTDALESIAERARKVIWLNPEPRAFWGLGDSIMDVYAPYCTKVTECGTLKQLSIVVEENLIP